MTGTRSGLPAGAVPSGPSPGENRTTLTGTGAGPGVVAERKVHDTLTRVVAPVAPRRAPVAASRYEDGPGGTVNVARSSPPDRAWSSAPSR